MNRSPVLSSIHILSVLYLIYVLQHRFSPYSLRSWLNAYLVILSMHIDSVLCSMHAFKVCSNFSNFSTATLSSNFLTFLRSMLRLWWQLRKSTQQRKSWTHQKTYLSKSVCSSHVTIEKWSPSFYIGGLILVSGPP